MVNECTAVSLVYRMKFTEDEILNLCDAAQNHYDGVCRVFEPLLKMRMYLENGLPLSYYFSWHDFDILSKICESPLVNEKVAEAVFSTFQELRERTHIASLAIGNRG